MMVDGVLRSVPFAGLPLGAIYFALLEWSRAAELTCDRASAIVCGDPLVVCRTLMRIAGGPVSDLNLDVFVAQSAQYEGEPVAYSRYCRLFDEIRSSHPYPVRRVGELMAWVDAGELDRIWSGNFVRKGEEPPPSAEFEAAFEHYRGRFMTIVDRASDGVSSVLDRLTSWLNSEGDGADD